MSSSAWDSHRLALQTLVRDVRREKCLTQKQLAEQLDKPQSYVSKYESGERRLDIIELRAVCLACGVSLEAFSSRLEQLIQEQ